VSEIVFDLLQLKDKMRVRMKGNVWCICLLFEVFLWCFIQNSLILFSDWLTAGVWYNLGLWVSLNYATTWLRFGLQGLPVQQILCSSNGKRNTNSI